MIKRSTILVCFIAACTMLYAAKEKAVKTVIRSWQLSEHAYTPDSISGVDTCFLNLPMRTIDNDYSISNTWNGNIVSPIQSRIYFQRRNTIEDIFGQNYHPYIITTKDIRFYNSTIPYSSVAYKKGFTKQHEENEINFFFTGNINRRLNLGLELNYLNSPGHYMHQEAKLFNGQVFGSYSGTHYTLHAGVTFNTLSNFENGGLKNIEDLSGPLQPEDLPSNIQAMSGYSYIGAFLNQSYSITKEEERIKTIRFKNNFGEEDTRDTTITEYIPMLTFAHTFELNNSRRRYVEKSPYQGFYANTYRNHNATNDSTNVLTISNTLSFTFEEAYNHLLRFGATIFARNECQRHLFGAVPQAAYDISQIPLGTINIGNGPHLQWMTDTLFRQQWTNNTFLGGAIYKKTGSYVKYDIEGEVCLLGYKIGEFDVDGKVDIEFPVGKDSMFIQARAYVRNETPNPYLRHYESNHYKWDNNFTKPFRFYVGGTWSYPTYWVKPSVTAGFENITNLIYFEKSGLPTQYNGNIQVISADAQLDITTPWVNLENHIVWQHSTNEALPLPMLTLYHNLYYHGSWFKHAMDAQFGVDLRYFTRYYAPILNPSTGQFVIQDEQKVGNYPIINIYANFYVHLIHLKFFAQYQHINHLFMRDNLNYMAMPGYPMNPDIFRAGLVWHFLR